MAKQVELVATAADFACVQYALAYGADAVCLCGGGGTQLSKASQITEKELQACVAMAHEWGKKIYMSLGAAPGSSQLTDLPGAMYRARSTGVDALVLADQGVLHLAETYAPGIDIHFSLSNASNYAAVYAAHERGARRVLLSSALTLKDIALIHTNTPRYLELETLLLGELRAELPGWHLLGAGVGEAVSRSFSMRQGERKTGFEVIDEPQGSVVVNSQDLNALPFLDKVIDAGVTSLRVAVPGWYNTAVAVAACRAALDLALSGGGYQIPQFTQSELERVQHRPWGSGFYLGGVHTGISEAKPGPKWRAVGMVTQQNGSFLYCQLCGLFHLGQTLEALAPPTRLASFTPQRIWNAGGKEVAGVDRDGDVFIVQAPDGPPWPAGTLLRSHS